VSTDHRPPSPERRPPPHRRWRDYRTASGRSPVADFIGSLSDGDALAVLMGMADVRDRRLRAGRHLEGDLWEVRARGDRAAYRVLFAEEGARGRVLLALEAPVSQPSSSTNRGGLSVVYAHVAYNE
jgi:hypothetical protein